MPFHFRTFVLALIVFCSTLPAAEPDPITTALQPFVVHHTLAGAVALVANKDAVLSVQAVGFADIEAKKAMPVDALFWIASMSKPITCTAVMMLVDEGKVRLDDPVEKFIPEFKDLYWLEKVEGKEPVKHIAPPLTVRQILSHTSGLAFKSAAESPTLDCLPLKDAVLSYTKQPLAYEPSTKYQYSNAGINTGGRIIEIVSGMSYEDFLQKRIFDPLGMKDTTFWPNEEQLTRLAKSYKPNAAKDNLEAITVTQLKYPLSDHATRFPMPGGGLFSTAADLAKYCRMLLNGGTLDGKKYLSEDALKEMSKRQTPASLKDSYGLGNSVGDGWYGHGGAYATNMEINTKQGLTFIWLVQHAGFPGDGNKAQGAFKSAAQKQFVK